MAPAPAITCYGHLVRHTAPVAGLVYGDLVVVITSSHRSSNLVLLTAEPEEDLLPVGTYTFRRRPATNDFVSPEGVFLWYWLSEAERREYAQPNHPLRRLLTRKAPARQIIVGSNRQGLHTGDGLARLMGFLLSADFKERKGKPPVPVAVDQFDLTIVEAF